MLYPKNQNGPGHLSKKKFVHVLGIDDDINRFMMKNTLYGFGVTSKMYDLWTASLDLGEQKYFSPNSHQTPPSKP
jgi:hypothetical protein